MRIETILLIVLNIISWACGLKIAYNLGRIDQLREQLRKIEEKDLEELKNG